MISAGLESSDLQGSGSFRRCGTPAFAVWLSLAIQKRQLCVAPGPACPQICINPFMSETNVRTTRRGATLVAEAPPAASFWRSRAFSGVSSLCPHCKHAGEYVQPHSRRQTPGVAASTMRYPPAKLPSNCCFTGICRRVKPPSVRHGG